jgi:A/G-specific adenine glycosylase
MPAEWCELPGVGPYTAAAITSISFGEPVACVDGNVVRILARLTGEARRFRDGAEAAKFFTPLANALVDDRDPGAHNQAMMELGATICVRAHPRCASCPVAEFCVGRKSGTPENFPRLKSKQVEKREVARAWCEHQGRLLLRHGDAKAKRLAGLHELPELADVGVKPVKSSLIARKCRSITRFQITESIHRVKPTAPLLKRIARVTALEWVPLAQLHGITLSGPHKRWIEEIRKL